MRGGLTRVGLAGFQQVDRQPTACRRVRDIGTEGQACRVVTPNTKTGSSGGGTCSITQQNMVGMTEFEPVPHCFHAGAGITAHDPNRQRGGEVFAMD
jgi:hypothetical protein